MARLGRPSGLLTGFSFVALAAALAGCDGGTSGGSGGDAGDGGAGGGSGGQSTGGQSTGGQSTGGQGGAGGQACVPEPEACDGIDNDCDAEVDEDCDCVTGATQACYSGDPATQGVGKCADGMQTCDAQGKWGPCEGEVLPENVDECDGVDNDCNGEADDNIAPQTCGVGACLVTVPGCDAGQVPTCTPGMPGVEVCDGMDNDCDGADDEEIAPQTCGVGACAVVVAGCESGQVPPCVPGMPSLEVCDGMDNDCDGMTDESDPALGSACDSGQLGVCMAGTQQCLMGVLSCVATNMASLEACDGLDNNCDGAVDDGNPGGGQACTTGLPGVCAAGTTNCANGAVECVQSMMASPEACDGLDNNCDGAVDDGNPGSGQACDTGNNGVCAAGTTTCNNGAIECIQTSMASPEVCDGQDNNCDGVVDDGNPGGGAACGCGFLGAVTCSSGALACQVPAGQPALYFEETFTNNSKGWTLGTTWAIGPTAVSSGHNYGGPDPAMDHTPTADNGVAGVVLGGNAPTTVHGYYYLTSPVINTGGIAGSVFLNYWRWLNSDYANYMVNQVQVYNGTTWVTLYQTGGSPGVQDSSWVKQTFDITAHKNANMQIRFGYQTGSGVYTVSSWNVDDVQITSAACP